MAIQKMKKLRLMAVRSQKDALLRELIRYGCVEFSELEEELHGTDAEAVVTREGSELTGLKSQYTSLSHAIDLLGRYAPSKGKLLSAKPELDGNVLLDDSSIPAMRRLAEKIENYDARIKRLSGEESRLHGVEDSLLPWMSLDMPLDTESTQKCTVLLGTMPIKTELLDAQAAIAQVSEKAELFEVSNDKQMHYLVLVCIKEDFPPVQDCLRGMGFAAVSFSGMKGTAKHCYAETQKSITALLREKDNCTENIVAQAVRRDELKLAADRLSVKISLAEANDKLYGTKSTIVMEGWIPEENEEELAKVFERYGCAWETSEPEVEEYPEVPVKLKNNRVTNALNMVTNMYSLPAYGSLDPNPLMAPFFILFYGLMMADMGYGILMIVAALVAMKKIKPRDGSLSFCQLLLYGGISTFVMGAITGSFFGDALEQVGKMLSLGDGWGRLPALFSPMNDSMAVLIGAMAIGIVHLNTGMVINFVKKTKRGQLADAIWEEGALWVTLVGIVLFVLKLGNIGGVPVVLIIGGVMVLYGGSRGAKGFGKITSIFGTIYNTVTGWFGDILSYSRIMALMLAGSVIATVFNTIAGITNNIVFFLLIFIVGHALNFALNLLGCYVHDLRLQCLEYFGKFYEDGGRAFAPLKLKTKYFNVAE